MLNRMSIFRPAAVLLLGLALPLNGVSATVIAPEDDTRRDMSFDEVAEVWAYYTGFAPTPDTEIDHARVTPRPDGAELHQRPFKHYDIRLSSRPVLTLVSESLQTGHWIGVCAKTTYSLDAIRNEPPEPAPQTSNSFGLHSEQSFALPSEEGVCAKGGNWVTVGAGYARPGFAYHGLATTQSWLEEFKAQRWTCNTLDERGGCEALARLLKSSAPPVPAHFTYEIGPVKEEGALITDLWQGSRLFRVRFERMADDTFEVRKIEERSAGGRP
ncbi:hypothetical protein [Gimibacter soli]|uniref:Uncharacterized protein n=1 Tax=Gimibacter soli TaxID=3024400 RepID=A0AAE9XR52_9PROT|nr:hypothetical protein [Gimibacter soli]WCL54697.1 hypothetical protein PH603_02845 [Gimibacter soli]